MGVPKRLTEMQMKFAHLLVVNEGRKTGYECAKEAGYSEDRARVTSSELQSPKKYPLVVKDIGEIREEYQKKYEVTYERHITELGKIRAEALKKGAWSAAATKVEENAVGETLLIKSSANAAGKTNRREDGSTTAKHPELLTREGGNIWPTTGGMMTGATC